MKAVLLACLIPFGAHAQTCLPATSDSKEPAEWTQPAANKLWIGSPMRAGVTKNGAWVRWYCAEVGTGQLRVVTYVGTLAEFSKVGGRLQTIVSAADPLKSLQTLPSRVTVLPLTHPSLAAIVADIK